MAFCSIRLIAAVAIVLQVPAAAYGQDEKGQIVWNDLRVGMTKKEVRALYPKGRTSLTESCYAVVSPDFESGRLVGVRLEYALIDKKYGCPDIVLQSLISKYGAPDQRQDDLKIAPCLSPYAGGIAGALGQLCEATGAGDPKQYVYLGWVREGIAITFKQPVNDTTIWRMEYKPLPKPSTERTDKL